MRYPLTDKIMERKDLGILSVIIDIVIMTCFLFAIWIMSYLVRLDSERHKRLLFETKEFSVIVNNLPKITSLYTIEDLKADLYIHFQQIVKDQPNQIEKLKTSDESRTCEIIDIQFAMSDYQFLQDIVNIKKISQQIEKLDIKIEEADDKEKIEELEFDKK